MRRTRRQVKRSSPTSETHEDHPKKMKVTKTIPKVSDDSSSESDIENYLQSAKDIDFNSSFFKTTVTATKDFEQIENGIFSGINRLSDSESETEVDDSNYKMQSQIKQPDTQPINTFEHINVYNKKLDDAKKQIQIYKARKEMEEDMNISNILAIGESKSTDNVDIHADSDDIERYSDSGNEDWEDVDDIEEAPLIPAKGVEITVELPGNIRKKKGVDLMSALRRRLNRIKKETQVFIHKVHLLCWIAHGNYVNKILSSESLMGLALSLLPSQQSYPPDRLNLSYLENILKWFTKAVVISDHQEEGELTDLLEQQIFKKVAYNNKMLAYIFVCILRSLGIRCRLILSLQVEPLRPPLLDVNSECEAVEKKNSKPEQSNNSKTPKSKVPQIMISTPNKCSSKKKNAPVVVSTKKISHRKLDLKLKNIKVLKKVNFEDMCSLETDDNGNSNKGARNSDKPTTSKSHESKEIKNTVSTISKAPSNMVNTKAKGNINKERNGEESNYFGKKIARSAKSTTSDNKGTTEKLARKVEDKLNQKTKNKKGNKLLLEETPIRRRSPRHDTNEPIANTNTEGLSTNSQEFERNLKRSNEIKEKLIKNKERSVSLNKLSAKKENEKKISPKSSAQRNPPKTIKDSKKDNASNRSSRDRITATNSIEEKAIRRRSPRHSTNDLIPNTNTGSLSTNSQESERDLKSFNETKEKSIINKQRSVSLYKLSAKKENEKKISPKSSAQSNSKTTNDIKKDATSGKTPRDSVTATNSLQQLKIKMPFKLKSDTEKLQKIGKEQKNEIFTTVSIKVPSNKNEIKTTENKSEQIPQLDGANDSTDNDSKTKKTRTKPDLEKLKNSTENKCAVKDHPKRLKKIIDYKEIDSGDDFKTTKPVIKKDSNLASSSKLQKANLDKLKSSAKKISSQSSSESDRSKYFGSPINSGKMDVRGDIMNLVKQTLTQEKNVLRSKLVKHKRVSNSSDDSDFMPEPTKKKPANDSSVKVKKRIPMKKDLQKIEKEKQAQKEERKKKKAINVWVEVFVEAEEKWISVDVAKNQIHCVNELFTRATHPVSYILSWDNASYIKDVTKRYCKNWNTVTRKLRVDDKWWTKTILPYKGPTNARDREEDEDLERQQFEQPLPKVISEYKNHPLYVLERHLLKFEAIYPPNALRLGHIRKEPVYSRDCVHVLHSREIWLKHAKVVKPSETPYKIVKARPKYDRLSNTFTTDQLLEIFGKWQVEDYVPPTAENGIVPRNAYGNVELFKSCMLPKGTVHLQLPSLNKVARKLNIDCAPAVVGFDFHGGWSHPTFDGFVVCEEYSEKLVAAWFVEQEEAEKREQEKIEKRVYDNWRRLIRGLFIRERLKAKYDFGEPSSSTSKQSKGKQKGNLTVKKRKIHSDSDSESEK